MHIQPHLYESLKSIFIDVMEGQKMAKGGIKIFADASRVVMVFVKRVPLSR
jgi:hypothetical protein